MSEGTGDPEYGGDQAPDQDAAVIVEQRVPAQMDEHDGAAPDLHQDEGPGEDEATVPEGIRNRRPHDEADQHGGEQEPADARRLRVEPIGHPGGILPAEPDREPQHQRLDRAHQRQMMHQPVGKLGDREDIDEIEEQFLERHLGVMPVALPQQGVTRLRRNIVH